MLIPRDRNQRIRQLIWNVIREMTSSTWWALTPISSILTEVGQSHNKPIAITETGFEAIPDSTWWTQTLYPVISKYPISYVLVWRNARERVNHYYAPYPGQVSADDFVKFYREPETLFVSDVKDLYK